MRRLAALLVVVLAGVQPQASRAQDASTPFGFEGRDVTSPTSANAWLFQKGHTLRVEVTGNDAPCFRPNNQAFTANIAAMRIALPVR